MRAISIIQEAKYKLVYLMHSQAQTSYTIEKYMHRKITQCKLHAIIRPYVHNKYFNWLAPIRFSVLISRQEFLKELGT